MRVIGITGVARVGKDTLCANLIKAYKNEGLVAKRFALADELKDAMRIFLFDNFNIDILNCSPEDKELIRPLLVEFGRAKRIQSNGTYWTSLLYEKMLKAQQEQPFDIAIVTDIRYAEYDFDEVDWLHSHDGTLIHLSRFLLDGSLLQPPNQDEEKNDPILFEKADIVLRLETDLEKLTNSVKSLTDAIEKLWKS